MQRRYIIHESTLSTCVIYIAANLLVLISIYETDCYFMGHTITFLSYSVDENETSHRWLITN
jgi:hypothetical protein